MFSWFASTDNPSNPPPPSYRDEPTLPPGAMYAQSAKSIKPLDLPCLNALRGKRVILASASPRRKQLLAQIGLTKLDIVPSDFAEDLDKSKYTAIEYVLETAQEKCMSVYKQEIDSDDEPTLVISADTIICSYLGGIVEKPLSYQDHIDMLKQLRDSEPHKVITAVCVMSPLPDGTAPGYVMDTHVEETIVKFDKNVTDELIESYVRTGEGADKAGGYGIQGLGTILVESVNGSYDNVVGLPLRGTLKAIENVIFPGEQEAGDIVL
ncbi:hypothetical protein TWF569_006479 [Orbilia oligospora]|uniref:Maf-like protein n=1 Tax=Orbilia oligospora TaxID=2813651 RepID=A0A7C8KKF7_ORBOL|nr:hypothetical protein TWF103_011362 [Orbilia oligospora]KAF3107870.1 hypothetical protein TWF102_011361 [Orbilia oligospora]KAF3145930.1 hypothetical protein TWF569_006479 [Orbilia oligospora]KAF3170125.1 hypothetical protein TWF751_006941 [Orbilia oligospora]KAF3177746.1 hypothetical protein TWF225_008026 [Orbilia oligospora]